MQPGKVKYLWGQSYLAPRMTTGNPYTWCLMMPEVQASSCVMWAAHALPRGMARELSSLVSVRLRDRSKLFSGAASNTHWNQERPPNTIFDQLVA
jgi:hypothetical protein